MPVLVVGADTPVGEAVVEALVAVGGEVRAFVSDPEVAGRLKDRKVKVAFGDLSDASHVGAAARKAFSVVLIRSAGRDGRELSFVSRPDELPERWAEALRASGTRRIIWVGPPEEMEALRGIAPEVAAVWPGERSAREVAEEVVRLDAARTL